MEINLNDAKTRTNNVNKNIIYSFLLKLLGIVITFFLLPLTVNYLTEVEYGVWITLFTIMNWVTMLDMGVGLGLRNKLAEAVANNDVKKIRIYISTGIVAITFIGMVLLMLFLCIIDNISLQKIYNTTLISEIELYNVTFWTGIFVIITFVLSIVNQFYYAWQKAAVTGFINIMQNFIMLVLVYILTMRIQHELLFFVFSFGIASLTSRGFFLLSFFFHHSNIIPGYSFIRLECIKDICSLGIKFFIVQLASIVMFSSANILITQKLGPIAVQGYDVIFKVFSLITLMHGILCTPLWSAYTEAWVNKDYMWIKRTISKLLKLMLPLMIVAIILILFIDRIIDIWIRTHINYDDYLVCGMAFYVLISCWMNIWTYFLNGIGQVNVQMLVTISGSVVLIPLAWICMDKWGSAGMIIACDICLLLESIPLMIHTKRILRKK